LTKKYEQLKEEYELSQREFERAMVEITETKNRLEEEIALLHKDKIVVQEELERQKNEAVQLNRSIAEKTEMIKQADQVIRSMSRIMSNPRSFSMNDGLTPISQEPCAFMVSFGFLLVDGAMRPGISVFRQQRRTLVRTGKQLFDAPPRKTTHLQAISFRRRIRHDYGVLGTLREKRLALIEDFALPAFYSADDFIYPHCDKMLNESERFLLLNTANAVSFVNALLEMNNSNERRRTLESEEMIEQRRENENNHVIETNRCIEELIDNNDDNDNNDPRLKEMAALLRRCNQSRQYKRKRACGNVEYARKVISEDLDEDERAQATKRLIECIVFDDPTLKPALTLQRYKYRTNGDGDGDDNDDDDNDGGSFRSATTVFYSTDPTVSGREIMKAIFALWQKLIEAMRIATTTSLEECLRDLLSAL
jgi:hypothetical protein